MVDVWAVGPDRVRRGQLEVLEWAVVSRDCDEGTWTLTVVDDDLSRTVVEGWRVIIRDDTGHVCSGPVLSYGGDVADGTLTLSGIDDTGLLGFRVTYPDPSKPASQQTTDANFKYKAAASNVIDRFVHRNVGSGAIASRQVPGFVMARAEGGNIGSSVTVNTRYKSVLEEARAMARLGGVTFWAAQAENSTLIRFHFRVPGDKSRWVRFTRDDGGLTGGTYSIAAPTVTAVLVAGQGVGTARTIKEHTQPTVWGQRVEVFQDRRDTDDAEQLEQAGTETLAEGAASASCTVEVTEIPGLVYGVDYQLGDTVMADFGSAQITEPVRSVEITGDAFGRTVKLTLGDHATDDDNNPEWVKQVRAISRRLRGLENI